MSAKKTSPDTSKDENTKGVSEEASNTEEEASISASDKDHKKKKDKATEELEKAQKELAAEKDKYLRILAEYDNFRKRSQKERENIYTDVYADTVSKFLPIYDNLERAVKQETCDEAYSKGVEMIMTQLKDIISKLGVVEIEASAGTVFDPSVHNAVMHIEDENLGESIVAEEFQKGFRLGDKVLRCSIVKVAN